MPAPTTRSDQLRVPTRLGDLHVRSIGTGVPALFWSSMFVDSGTWLRLLPLLPDRRCVLVDPPGLGRSEPLHRRTSIAEAADAATELIGELRRNGVLGDEPVDWVGNAFGGHVGFELASRAGTLRSLVAISSPPEPISTGLRRQIRLLQPLLRTFGPVGPVRAAITGAMLTDRSAADLAVTEIVSAALARPTRASMNRALQSFILDRRDVQELLPQIAVPALFVAGDDRGDWSPADARRAASATPDARSVIIAGSRTLVPLEQPELLARALVEFWNTCDSATAAPTRS